jgi:flavin reductase (DIM6/NTAB) family NADH-FMN oxidoreductase RutF
VLLRARSVLPDVEAIEPQGRAMTDEVADFMQTITTGIYVIGVTDGERTNAFAVSAVMPVSFKPVMVAITVGLNHTSLPLLRAGKAFTINVLKRDQLELASHFGWPIGLEGTTPGRQTNKLATIHWRPGLSGAPILMDSLAYIECELASVVPAGDHELVLGKVVDGAVLASGEPPLLCWDIHNSEGARDLDPTQRALARKSQGPTLRAHPFTLRC